MITAPRTLLEIAGAKPRPVDLSKAAVVLIDAQREYHTGVLPLAGIEDATVAAAALLAAARDARAPVIHVFHHGRPGAPAFDPERDSVRPIASLEPCAGEKAIIKTLPNSFARTDLQAYLETLGVSELILAGFMTHMCVSSTTRAALDLGYSCTVVANATATRDLPSASRVGVIPASHVQAAALAALADRFARVVPSVASLLSSKHSAIM